MKRLHRDSHPGPHPMTSYDGCACTCNRCVRLIAGRYYCVCPRCSEDCPSIGRMGDADSVAREQKEEHMVIGEPAKRWYWA